MAPKKKGRKTRSTQPNPPTEDVQQAPVHDDSCAATAQPQAVVVEAPTAQKELPSVISLDSNSGHNDEDLPPSPEPNPRRSLRIPTPTCNRLPVTVMGIDAPAGRKKKQARPADALDSNSELGFDEVAGDFFSMRMSKGKGKLTREYVEDDDGNPHYIDTDDDENDHSYNPPQKPARSVAFGGVSYADTPSPSIDEHTDQEEDSPPPQPGRRHHPLHATFVVGHEIVRSPDVVRRTQPTHVRRGPIPRLPAPRREVGSRLAKEGKERCVDVHQFIVPVDANDPHSSDQCSFCLEVGQNTIYGEGTNTATRRNHLASKHADLWIKACDDRKISIHLTGRVVPSILREYRHKNGQELDAKLEHEIFTHRRFLDYIMELVITEDLAFRIVDAPSLRKIFLMLHAPLRECDIPHATSLRQMIMEAWVVHMHNLKAELKDVKSKISYSMDGWSDVTLHPFIAVVASWIEVVQRTDGKKHLQLRSELIGCFAHIVHLAVTAAINAVEKGDIASQYARSGEDVPDAGLFTRVRELVRVLCSSGTHRTKLQALALRSVGSELKLLKDIVNRWSSSNLMLIRLQTLHPAIELFLRDIAYKDIKINQQLCKAEWRAIDDVIRLLKIPHAFQQRLSSDRIPTLCNALSSFNAMSDRLKELKAQTPQLKDAVDAALDKIDDYYNRLIEVPAYFLSMIVNPKIKMKYIQKEYPGEYLRIKRLFVDEIGKKIAPGQRRYSDPKTADWATDVLRDSENSNTLHHLDPEAKADAYLNNPEVGESIEYWGMNSERFPRVYLTALDFLPIQGTSVPCERVFSSAKLTKGDLRNLIAPDIMEALQILKFAYKRDGKIMRELNFTGHLDYEHELAELEEIAGQIVLPETDELADYAEIFQELPPPSLA